MRGQDSASFAFAPDLILGVRGPARLVEEFRHEYRRAIATDRDPHVEVIFARALPAGTSEVAGGHKTVRWRVALSRPDATPLSATVSLAGAPATFARSLVQGYYVEPLLSIAAARTGRVLLPAAAFERAGSAVVVMGRSRSGKSTLAARVGAAGGTVLGDDQVLVAPGACSPFPRRTRVYSDLRRTAPEAYRRLRRRERLGLLARAAARRLTLGWVAPSLAVEPFGSASPGDLPIGRVVLIERDTGAAGFETSELPSAAAVEAGVALLDEQRRWLAAADAWGDGVTEAAELERRTLHDTFTGVDCQLVRLPSEWAATQALNALTRHLTLDR